MIDWLTFDVVCPHDPGAFDAGFVLCVDRGGRTEWVSQRKLFVPGSHDSTIRVRTSPGQPPGISLQFSGNPVKWQQGHNIFGSDDLCGLARDLVVGVFKRLGQPLDPRVIASLQNGVFKLLRVDINYSWLVPCAGDALEFIRSLSANAYLSHRGRGELRRESTCSWGKGSQYWWMKAYHKGSELRDKGHRLPRELAATPALQEYADRCVRFEVQLNAKELRRAGLDVAASWHEGTAAEVHSRYLARLQISDATMSSKQTPPPGLPEKLMAVYQLWADGHDLRQLYPKRTWYRHRKALLAFGIDIAVQQPRRDEAEKVVPLRKVLIARPAGVPEWALGTQLYYEPDADILGPKRVA
jgi:hypothetical protein